MTNKFANTIPPNRISNLTIGEADPGWELPDPNQTHEKKTWILILIEISKITGIYFFFFSKYPWYTLVNIFWQNKIDFKIPQQYPPNQHQPLNTNIYLYIYYYTYILIDWLCVFRSEEEELGTFGGLLTLDNGEFCVFLAFLALLPEYFANLRELKSLNVRIM